MSSFSGHLRTFKVCIIRLDHICFEKSSSTFWQVRFFQTLWPSQKTQTLISTITWAPSNTTTEVTLILRLVCPNFSGCSLAWICLWPSHHHQRLAEENYSSKDCKLLNHFAGSAFPLPIYTSFRVSYTSYFLMRLTYYFFCWTKIWQLIVMNLLRTPCTSNHFYSNLKYAINESYNN